MSEEINPLTIAKENIGYLTGVSFSLDAHGDLKASNDLNDEQFERLSRLEDLKVIKISQNDEGDLLLKGHDQETLEAFATRQSRRLVQAGNDELSFDEAVSLDELSLEDYELEEVEELTLSGSHDQDDEDLIEEKKRRRRQYVQEENERLRQENERLEAELKSKQDNEKPSVEEEQIEKHRTKLGALGHAALGVHLSRKNGTVSMKPDRKGQLSEKQLRAMIKDAFYELGYDTIHIYDGKGRINDRATGDANKLIAVMTREGELPSVADPSDPSGIKRKVALTASYEEQDYESKPKAVRRPFEKMERKYAALKQKIGDAASAPKRKLSNGMAWKEKKTPAAESAIAGAAAASAAGDDQAGYDEAETPIETSADINSNFSDAVVATDDEETEDSKTDLGNAKAPTNTSNNPGATYH
jgi:hypothetical protein